MHPYTRRERAFVRLQAREGGQQRWMDIDQSARVSVHELRRQHAHEPGEHDDGGLVTIDLFGQGAIELIARRELAVVDHARRYACAARDLKSRGIGPATDDRRDSSARFCTPILPARSAEQRFEIAATARDQDNDVLHFASLYRLDQRLRR
jgi:hypothetical protein